MILRDYNPALSSTLKEHTEKEREQKRDGGVAIRQTLHVPTYTQVHL